MQDFKLALISQESRLDRVEENLASTIAWTQKASRRGAQLIAFPELSVTGHGGHPSMIRVAEPVPDGPICKRLTQVAADHNVYLSVGMAERDGAGVYNSQVIIGPDGVVGRARKLHLSNDEYFHFRHGTKIPVFDLPFAKVGAIICYDNLFPEHAGCLALGGAELILAPHAARTGVWRKKPADRKALVKRQMDHYRLVHPTRAYDHSCYVGVCNAVGRAAQAFKGVDANHAGGCLVADPSGTIVKQTPIADFKEQMIVVDLKASAVAEQRERICHPLQTRRGEVFAALGASTE